MSIGCDGAPGRSTRAARKEVETMSLPTPVWVRDKNGPRGTRMMKIRKNMPSLQNGSAGRVADIRHYPVTGTRRNNFNILIPVCNVYVRMITIYFYSN